jgi:hypothetical protein
MTATENIERLTAEDRLDLLDLHAHVYEAEDASDWEATLDEVVEEFLAEPPDF